MLFAHLRQRREALSIVFQLMFVFCVSSFLFSSGCFFKFSASIRSRYCFLPSVNREINLVFLSFQTSAASSESNHSTAGPRTTEPKRAFRRSSYTVWMLFSFTAGLLPSEKLIFLSNKRINAVGSSL